MGMVEGDGRKGGGIVRERDGSGVARWRFLSCCMREKEEGGREIFLKSFLKLIFL